jgi:hypothetical protein
MERAVTLGEVARLRAQAGDVAGARELQVERLAVNRGLGDLDGIGAAQYDLALLDLEEGQVDSARTRLAEAWEIFQRIRRADFIAIAGKLYGRLLAEAGEREAAVAVLRESRAAYQLLGREDQCREVEAALARLTAGEGAPRRRSFLQRLRNLFRRRPAG